MKMNGMVEKQNEVEKKPSRKKYIIAAVVVLLLITPISVFMMLKSGIDPASEKVIREAAAAELGKDPNELTDDDFMKITELSFKKLQKNEGSVQIIYYSFELSDLRFLEKFTNLQKLNLAGVHFLRNKMPIWMKIMEKFGYYDLWGKYSSEGKFEIDLSPLKKLPNLKELHLSGPYFNDIKPLSKVNNLEYLYLQECYTITKYEEEDLKKDLQNLKIVRLK
jgi:hypothetical protein